MVIFHKFSTGWKDRGTLPRKERGLGLLPLAEGFERSEILSRDLMDVFENSFGRWWLTSVLDAEPVLAGFASAEHERKIREFRDIDQQYLDLTKGIIASRLAAKVSASAMNSMANNGNCD